MKYHYVYRTGDGIRHTDVIEAPSRDAAFAALRANGIRPIKVQAEDGSRENGAPRPIRGRLLIFILLALVVTATVILLLRTPSTEPEFLVSQTRRQVIGDAAVIERGILTGWEDVFESDGDRFLASFAIPGARAGVRNVTEGELLRVLNEKLLAKDAEGIEARQIRSIVEGLKDEARAYLRAGGTIASYASRLTERQDAESAVYSRVRGELERARKSLSEEAYLSAWEEKNAALRRLGIRTIPLDAE